MSEELRGEWRWLTWSVKVSQCALSIRVTTRPGAEGVPRWSSLCVVLVMLRFVCGGR